jgi:hypothetical protein
MRAFANDECKAAREHESHFLPEKNAFSFSRGNFFAFPRRADRAARALLRAVPAADDPKIFLQNS